MISPTIEISVDISTVIRSGCLFYNTLERKIGVTHYCKGHIATLIGDKDFKEWVYEEMNALYG
jgi:hypothetical protein